MSSATQSQKTSTKRSGSRSDRALAASSAAQAAEPPVAEAPAEAAVVSPPEAAEVAPPSETAGAPQDAPDASKPSQTAGAADKTSENPVHAVIDSISERIKTCMAQLKETDAMLKQLTKDTKKLCKKRTPSGKPSNLTLPLGISKDLADFLAVPAETTITRSAVTKAINEYAVAQGLKLPGNGRIIKLDDRLAALLGKSNGFEIPIINVQTHLRDHYVKLTPPPAAE